MRRRQQHVPETKLESGHYDLLFSHPEAFVSCKYGRDVYQKTFRAVVVDEAHCILEWYVRI